MLLKIVRRTRTLRVRFALWVAALLLLTFGAFAGFVYVIVARGLDESIDESLKISAGQAIAAVNIENGRTALTDAIPLEIAADLRERGLTIRVLEPNGRIVEAIGRHRGMPIDQPSLRAAQQRNDRFATLKLPSSDTEIRWYTAPIITNQQLVGIVQVAQSREDVRESLARIVKAFLSSIPFLVAIAALGGYLLAWRALKPIDRITRTARRLSAEELHARLNLPASDDEVGRLAATFDQMLARLDAAFQRERRFTADASHELRTPLAAMQLILSVTRAEQRTPEEYEQALDDLADETNRLRVLTDDLLRLSRSDNRPTSSRQCIDLAELVGDVAETLRPLAEARDLTLACALPHDLRVRGDRDSLIRLFVNLIDNAITYTPQGAIQISGQQRDSVVQIAIADTGIGIAPQHLPHIFERFYQIDPARSSDGAGLGLALAHDIVHAHHGTITVDSVPDVGTTFRITLPSASS